LEIVSYLLENGGNPDTDIERGKSAIMYASGIGAYDIVQTLIKHGANVAFKNGYHA
jgi:ankyrin repeat protein